MKASTARQGVQHWQGESMARVHRHGASAPKLTRNSAQRPTWAHRKSPLSGSGRGREATKTSAPRRNRPGTAMAAASGAWFQSWLDPVLNWLRRHAAAAHSSLPCPPLSHGSLVTQSLLQARDGADTRRPAELWEDDARQRRCGARPHTARTQPAAPPPLAGHRSRVAVHRRAAFLRT